MRRLKVNAKRLGNAWLVETPSDLPDLSGAEQVFQDFETKSGNPKVEAFHAYLGHRIAGVALTWDDHPDAFYIPIRHRDARWNLPVDAVLEWMREWMQRVPEWVNHNVKFDAHFAAEDGIEYNGRLIDTLTLAKCHDSDRFGHKLKPLAREWCGLPMSEVDEVEAWLKGAKSKDYGDCPADIMGRYACMDVLSNRELYRFLLSKRPDSLERIWETEIALTSVLFDMERTGLQTNEPAVKKELLGSLRRMIYISDRLHELTQREYTNSNTCKYDILVNQLGLPVVGYTDKGNASFDKDAMELYQVHPSVTSNDEAKEIVELIAEYSTESTFKGLFLEPYLHLSDGDAVLHPQYNQVIRTGRMSCRNPNSQQLNKRAKGLIKPRDGNAFLSYDASQIEFRIIVHYIQDGEAIEAYLSDPTTDFHQWVADICQIARSAAKNINFAVGYGAGKRKVTAMLSGNKDVIRDVSDEVNKLVEDGKIEAKDRDKTFRQLCTERADDIFTEYHERLPTLKKTSRRATYLCKNRGYIFNAFGRRRHLPRKASHKAFNSIVQGCAMDYIKDRMNALAPRYNEWIRSLGIEMVASVHDEILFEGPIAVMRDPEVQLRIADELEIQSVPFRVPFIWSGGYSETTWAEAAGDEIFYERDGKNLHEDLKHYQPEEGDRWLKGAIHFPSLRKSLVA